MSMVQFQPSGGIDPKQLALHAFAQRMGQSESDEQLGSAVALGIASQAVSGLADADMGSTVGYAKTITRLIKDSGYVKTDEFIVGLEARSARFGEVLAGLAEGMQSKFQ